MNAKEKAIELVDNFRLKVLDYNGNQLNTFKALQCALIAVDEIIKVSTNSQNSENYWRQVKQEIENL
jgi:hypothetical protein